MNLYKRHIVRRWRDDYPVRGGVKLCRWRAWWRKFGRPANRYTRTFRV